MEQSEIEKLIIDCRSVRGIGDAWATVERVAFKSAPKLAGAAQELSESLKLARESYNQCSHELNSANEKCAELERVDKFAQSVHRRLDELKIPNSDTTMRGRSRTLNLSERVGLLIESFQDRIFDMEKSIESLKAERDGARSEVNRVSCLLAGTKENLERVEAERDRDERLLTNQETEISRLRTLTESSQNARRIEELETRERYHTERIVELERGCAEIPNYLAYTKKLEREYQAKDAALSDANVRIAELETQLAKVEQPLARKSLELPSVEEMYNWFIHGYVTAPKDAPSEECDRRGVEVIRQRLARRMIVEASKPTTKAEAVAICEGIRSLAKPSLWERFEEASAEYTGDDRRDVTIGDLRLLANLIDSR